MLLSNFFQLFHLKSPVVMPIIGQKNANSVKTTVYIICQKSQPDALFPRLITKKSLLFRPYFVQKTSILKKHGALMPIFCRKNARSLKNTLFSFHRRQFCQNYTILWAKKVNRTPLFSDFSHKIIALIPIFYQKNVYSQKT